MAVYACVRAWVSVWVRVWVDGWMGARGSSLRCATGEAGVSVKAPAFEFELYRCREWPGCYCLAAALINVHNLFPSSDNGCGVRGWDVVCEE